MDRSDVENALSSFLSARQQWEAIGETLRSSKREAVVRGDEIAAKYHWCLEQVLAAHQQYCHAFDLQRAGKFYDAWCVLEKVEIVLRLLAPHFRADYDTYGLNTVARWVDQWQGLYPYALFMSPEFIEHVKICSTCHQPIRIRTPCGHEAGEVYGGELCTRIVAEVEPVAMALVKSPVQKYSVPFSTDPTTGQTVDHYDYSVVRFAAERIVSPDHDWRYERTKVRHPHSRYAHVGRNEPCPCESGQKYKKCCLGQPGVLRPHIQFSFSVPPPPGLSSFEFPCESAIAPVPLHL